MLPLEIENLIMEYEQAIIIEKHPTAVMLEDAHALRVFEMCLNNFTSHTCPVCRMQCNLPFQLWI
jgi:hypothetical protein